MEIKFLGTGSAIPTRERQNLSLLLTNKGGHEIILVDCSSTPIFNILKNNYLVENLKHVIITHSHVDHIYALPSLLHGIWLRSYEKNEQSNTEIQITALPETMETVKGLINLFDFYNKPKPISILLNAITPSDNPFTFSFRNYKISPFHVAHGSMPTFGLAIENVSGEKLIYSSDSIITDAIESRLSANTRILIQDCGGGLSGNSSHAGAEEIAKMLAKKSLEKLYLVHLPDIKQKEITEITNVISKNFDGEIIIPVDGDAISF